MMPGSQTDPGDPAFANGLWPQHPLLRADAERLLDRHYLAKPVHETLLLDDMEQDGNWSASPAMRMEYTTERARSGTRSLRLRIDQRNEEHIRASRAPNGSFSGAAIVGDFNPFSSWIRLKLEPAQDWTRFNRISLWCYVHPTPRWLPHTLCLWFLPNGAPVGPADPLVFHFVPDLEPGQWNHIVWEIPEYRRDKVGEFVIFQQVHGVPYQGDGTLTYDFDQLRLERVDAEPYEGWEVLPGKIAFNHVGYEPSGEKTALASSPGTPNFDVLDAATGDVVASFPVQEIRNPRGNFQLLDFSALAAPGRYRLRCGDITTEAFAVADDLWYGPIEKALNFFYAMRCGFSIPELHDACHLDTRAEHEGEIKFINGGWHDAAGLGQGTFQTMQIAHGMLELYEQLRARTVRPELAARVLEEARWGVEWLLRIRFGHGWRVTRYVDNAMYTDNLLGTIDDAIFPSENVPFDNLLSVAVLARAASIYRDLDPDFSARLLAAAQEDYAAVEARVEPPQPAPAAVRGGGKPTWRDELAYATLAAVELYRLTGEPRYAADAARQGRRLLAQQEQSFVGGIPLTGYFYEDAQRRRIQHDYHGCHEDGAIRALRALCDTWPEHPHWIEWYGAVVLHSEFFLRRGAEFTAPYRMLPGAVWRKREIEELIADLEPPNREVVPTLFPTSELTAEVISQELTRMFEDGAHLAEDYRLRAFPIWVDQLAHGNTNVQLTCTQALVAAMLLRNRPELAALAGRQLQWVFGGNPFAQCLMYGEGYDFQRYYAATVPNLVGALPVGMNSLHGDAPFWPAVKQPAAKEIWGIPAGHFLGVMAAMALPAHVRGSAPAGAAFRQAQTGALLRIEPGSFELSLPPGEYAVDYGGATRRIVLVPGGSYSLSLDPLRTVEVTLSAATPLRQSLRVEALLHGQGTHSVELRCFNGRTEHPRREVELVGGQAEVLTWQVDALDMDTPWVVVAIPDGNMSERQELFGTWHTRPG